MLSDVQVFVKILNKGVRQCIPEVSLGPLTMCHRLIGSLAKYTSGWEYLSYVRIRCVDDIFIYIEWELKSIYLNNCIS